MGIRDSIRRWLGVETEEETSQRISQELDMARKLPPSEQMPHLLCPAGQREACSPSFAAVPRHDQEVVWLDGHTAKCLYPGCGWSREWPKPASDEYADQPWRCPKCGGDIKMPEDANGVVDAKTYCCIGMTLRIWKQVWPTMRPPTEFTKPCGWSGSADTFGKDWR